MIPMYLVLEGTNTVITAMESGLTTVAGDATAAIAAMVPIAIPVLGAMVVIRMAIYSFKVASGTKH